MHRVGRLVILSFCFIVGALFAPAAQADVLESARLLPDDTMVMLSIESIAGLKAALEKTSLHALYKDPVIRPLLADAEEKIRKSFDEGLKEFWKEIEVDNPPREIPTPQGRVIVGLSVVVQQPDAGASENDPGPDAIVRLVLLADMGDQAEQTKRLIRSLFDSARDNGATTQRREVAGIQMSLFDPLEDSDDQVVAYGMRRNWLVIGVDLPQNLDYVESVARRLSRTLPGSLADKPDLRRATRTLGEAEAFAYVNADAVRSLVAGMVPDKVKVERMTKALGLDNVTSLASAVQIAGHKTLNVSVKTLIGVEGPKRGIPALLSPASAPLRLNDRLVTRDAIGFACANYDPPKLFDGIAKMVMEMVFLDLNVIAQAPMAATAQEGGQPPVHLRDDVLAQAAAPLFVTWTMDKPYTELTGLKFLMGLSLRDGDQLDAALGRIHGAFLGSDESLQRELLDRTLYLFPDESYAEEFEEAEGPAPDAGAETSDQLAFSVTGENLVFGQVDAVEQAIRSRKTSAGKPIASDPMFRYARKHLPGQAGLYYYRNDRRDAEIAWTALKQLAKEHAQASQDQSEEDEEFEFPDPLAMLVATINEYVDLNRLPEFNTVAKYWGATVGFVQNRPEGIYTETLTLKPPAP